MHVLGMRTIVAMTLASSAAAFLQPAGLPALRTARAATCSAPVLRWLARAARPRPIRVLAGACMRPYAQPTPPCRPLRSMFIPVHSPPGSRGCALMPGRILGRVLHARMHARMHASLRKAPCTVHADSGTRCATHPRWRRVPDARVHAR